MVDVALAEKAVEEVARASAADWMRMVRVLVLVLPQVSVAT